MSSIRDFRVYRKILCDLQIMKVISLIEKKTVKDLLQAFISSQCHIRLEHLLNRTVISYVNKTIFFTLSEIWKTE